MYVYEEIIDGKKLTEIINETHENVKYLPKHKLPENVVSKKKICLIVNFVMFVIGVGAEGRKEGSVNQLPVAGI